MNHQSVLMLQACSGSQHVLLEQMIQQGQNVDYDWPGHLRLVHVAASRGDTRSMELLLLADADVNAVTARGESALFLAAVQGYGLIITQLQRARADINLSNHRGESPLHGAMAHHQYGCAAQLLWMGADTHGRSIHGVRAEDACAMIGQPKALIELFRASKLRNRLV